MLIDLLIFFISAVIMFIPSMIAFHRHLKRRWACLIVNALLGWTVICWIPIWIWSMLTNAVEEKADIPTGL